MADEPKSPEPPTPPVAAPDKPASTAPGEPLKAEVSPTDAPGAADRKTENDNERRLRSEK